MAGVQKYPHMPFDVNGAFVGHTDDVGDIDYYNFIPKMDEYRLNMSLDVGKNLQVHLLELQ